MRNNLIVGVIGLGYVGTPLALSLGRYFKVVGFDLNKNRISQLKKKKDITNETNLSEFNKAKKIIFSNKLKDLKNCNVFIIALQLFLHAKISALQLFFCMASQGSMVPARAGQACL